MDLVAVLPLQDPVSSLTHLLGAAGAAVAAVPLLRRPARVPTWLASAVFVTGVLAMFLASGVYHLLPLGDARGVAQRLDHAAIFYLIAATFTPALVDIFQGTRRLVLLGLAWTVCLAAMFQKLFFFTAADGALGLGLYLAAGWAGLVGGVFVVRRYGVVPLLPLFLGGVAYTVGAVCEFVGWPVIIPGVVGPHEVFHVFVILGVSLHWWYVQRTVRARALPTWPLLPSWLDPGPWKRRVLRAVTPLEPERPCG